MNILFIAPLPKPGFGSPVTGNSLAAKILFEELEKKHKVEVINLSKDSFKSGINSLSRIVSILQILIKIWHSKKKADIIYITVAESFAGNIRDLIIYLICFRKLKHIMIHMLGGAGIKKILENKGIQFKLNKFFISRLGGIIVEGQTQKTTFAQLISSEKIHIVPNFAEDFLFVNDEEIVKKFSNMCPLNILYLSNLINGKGYNELADAYLNLPENVKENVKIVFVGGFESDEHKLEFLKKIDGHRGLTYLKKFIYGDEKKALYCKSHIFCLPTYYPYEGQPISILEAYATGCVVVTTDHSGIPDIFCHSRNGFLVEKKSAYSIKSAIEQIMINKNNLLPIAISNKDIAAAKYRTTIFSSSILKIISDTKY